MDLQSLIDVHGNLYHIDVDRAFQSWPRGACHHTPKRFEPRIKIILDMVKATAAAETKGCR